jgi:hypothetical protein
MDKQQKAKLIKQFGKKSLPIRIMESDLFDWNPSKRLTLLVIALGTRSNDEAWVQEDCPWSAEDMVGWCDMSQWRISLRVGKSESQVHRDIIDFEKQGIIKVERWVDSNHANHDRYQINEAVIDEHQRPEQKPTVERPSRYKVKRHGNKGSFTARNQPRTLSAAVAGMDE